MAGIKAKCKFPQPCVVLALGRVRGLVAGRGRREGQTSPFHVPGACQACSGPCTGRKWVVSSAPALVSARLPLCPQSTWASGQGILSHCHALTGKLPKEMSPSPQNQQYWGMFCTLLGENITFQPQAPLTGSINLLFPPQLTFVSVPQGSGVMFPYCSCHTAVHQEPQMAALPSFSMQSQPGQLHVACFMEWQTCR